jgi:predicted acylesterase/phospholipase RssA
MRTLLLLALDPTALLELGEARRLGDGEVQLLRRMDSGEVHTFRVIVERDPSRALRWLAARPVDLVLLDARADTGLPLAEATAMLDRLYPDDDSHGLASRDRTLVLLDRQAASAAVAFRAGRCRIREPLFDPTGAEVLDAVEALIADHGRGKIALCLAGGGIEGLLYEVGALRALDRFVLDRRLCDFDLFFGISAGSFLAALLANGVTPDEIVDGLRNGNDRVPRIGRGDLFDPNLGELGRRAIGLARALVGGGTARNPLSALYRSLPSGVFAGERLEKYFGRALNRPGMSDHFEETRRPVFIGATDQDTSEAVVFGEPGWTDVPIHRAVRASCALAPFYAPTRIGGRWYVDGAFTRTTNMRVAVKHGASLCLIVDPLVPIYSRESGYVHARGGLFGAMQGLKALINGRFDKAHSAIAEMYPSVAFHIFRPEGEEMKILAGSPMKFLYQEEIEERAYESTLRQVRGSMGRLRRDFARHGVRFGEATQGPAHDAWLDGALAFA